MKTRLFILFLLALGLQPISLVAQTKQETLEWLQAKITAKASPFAEFISFESGQLIKPRTIQGSKAIAWDAIKYSKITDVSYKPSEDGYAIYFSGDFMHIKKIQLADGELLDDKEMQIKKSDIYFQNISEQEIQKFVKAIKHLAKLEGAKLVKDDLF